MELFFLCMGEVCQSDIKPPTPEQIIWSRQKKVLWVGEMQSINNEYKCQEPHAVLKCYFSRLPKIFDPYFTTKSVGEGSGLGLSTVHGIIKDHSGIIKVYSELNNGTTFQIFLPLVDAEAYHLVKSEGPLPKGNETILYVDDERFILDVGNELLKGLGYSVETRASSIDAFEAFRTNPKKFDLVISDMTMPKLTGVDLALKIQKIRPGIPIILCTGFSTKLNAERLKQIGVKKILMKPVMLHELAVSVRNILDQTKTSA